MEKNRLSSCSLSLKILITCLVLTLAVGYAVSLLQAYNRGSFDLKKTALHFRGSESENSEIYVPQSDTTMISVAHVHTFSQPVVLGVMGLLFVLTGIGEGLKVFWILLSFLSSLLMNAGPWLVRDVSPHFVSLLYFSGAGMVASFFVMAAGVLYEVWIRKEPG